MTSTLGLVRHGRQNGYAVPAVNVFDLSSLRGVVDAADEHRSPMIVQFSVKTVLAIGLDLVTEMFGYVAAEAEVPIALHLDHCPHRELIDRVIDAGWSSVLFDASDRDLATAERETRDVVARAHAAGVEVESEIENILGVEDGIGSDEARHSYDVATLAAVAERTGADLLAPQLGTAHGEYTERPTLRPERVGQLAALVDQPIVLHGGTGLTEAEFRDFISAGVAKINVSTAVKLSYLRAAGEFHEAVAARRVGRDPLALHDGLRSAVAAETSAHIQIFGSAGMADRIDAEVVAR